MDLLRTAKGATVLVLSTGAGYTVKTALQNLNDPVTKWQRIKVAAGSFVVGAMVADIAEKYVDQEFDKGVQAVKDMKRKWDDAWDKAGTDKKAPTEPKLVVEEADLPQEG